MPGQHRGFFVPRMSQLGKGVRVVAHRGICHWNPQCQILRACYLWFSWEKHAKSKQTNRREGRGTQNTQMRFLWKLNSRCRRLNGENKCVSVWLMRADKIIADGGWVGESEFYCTVLSRAGGSGAPGARGEPMFPQRLRTLGFGHQARLQICEKLPK